MLIRYFRRAGAAAVLSLTALSLAACAPGAQPAPPVAVQPSAIATPPLSAATPPPATAAPPTIAPPTIAPPTASPLPPTAAPPTAAPPTATPQPAPLVGPEWTVITTGDFDGNGVLDVVATKASPVIISAPGGYPVSVQVSELVLVERRPDGGPRVRLALNSRGVFADGASIASFGDANPAGFWVRSGEGAGALTITPLNGAGQQFTQDLLVAYSAEAAAYRLFPATGPRPQPQPPTATAQPGPLVGDDWTVLVSGDANHDGAEDVAAYIPAPLSLSGRALGPIYQGYLTASQVAVVQRGPFGEPIVQVHIVNGVALVNNQPAPGFPTAPGDVAGLLVSLAPDGALLLVAPVGYDGDVIGNGFAVVWDGAAGSYRIYPQQG